MKATTEPILSALARLDSGQGADLAIDPTLYGPESVRHTVLAFQEVCEIERRSDGRGTVVLRLVPRAGTSSRRLIGELLNYLLDHALQTRLLARSVSP